MGLLCLSFRTKRTGACRSRGVGGCQKVCIEGHLGEERVAKERGYRSLEEGPAQVALGSRSLSCYLIVVSIQVSASQ